MRVGLCVNLVGTGISDNINRIFALAHEAVTMGAELVLFPETAVTGLVTTDDPKNDIPLGIKVPGSVTERFSEFARVHGIWFAFGAIEFAEHRLYDTAILITPEGQIALKYRRVQPNWHGPTADPEVYCQGTRFPLTLTPSGRTMFLICGDLWDDNIVQHVRDRRPDLVLYPFARSFGGPINQDKWDDEEMNDYAERVRLLGCPTLMVNYLSDPSLAGWSAGCFGGAWVVREHAIVSHRFPLGKSGVLLADV